MITCSTSCSRDDLLEVPARAEDGQRDAGAVVGQRILVEEADRLQPELGLVEQARRREAADAAGADDERRAKPFAGDAGATVRPVERDAARADVDGREEPEPQRLVDVARGASDDGREREQRDRREPGRTCDATEIVGRAQSEARAVEPARRQQREDERAIRDRPALRNADDPGGARADEGRNSRQREHGDVDCHAAEPPRQTRPEAEPEGPALEARCEIADRVDGVEKLNHRPGCPEALVRQVYGRTRAKRLRPQPSRSRKAPPAVRSARSTPVKGSEPPDFPTVSSPGLAGVAALPRAGPGSRRARLRPRSACRSPAPPRRSARCAGRYRCMFGRAGRCPRSPRRSRAVMRPLPPIQPRAPATPTLQSLLAFCTSPSPPPSFLPLDESNAVRSFVIEPVSPFFQNSNFQSLRARLSSRSDRIRAERVTWFGRSPCSARRSSRSRLPGASTGASSLRTGCHTRRSSH